MARLAGHGAPSCIGPRVHLESNDVVHNVRLRGGVAESSRWNLAAGAELMLEVEAWWSDVPTGMATCYDHTRLDHISPQLP